MIYRDQILLRIEHVETLVRECHTRIIEIEYVMEKACVNFERRDFFIIGDEVALLKLYRRKRRANLSNL